MKEYKIIEGSKFTATEEFVEVINKLLRDGWELEGGVSSIGIAKYAHLIQALSRDV